MTTDIRIRKVKVLQGRARVEAEKKKLAPEDLVIVTTKVRRNSLPEYQIEKIDGDPVSYLLKRAKFDDILKKYDKAQKNQKRKLQQMRKWMDNNKEAIEEMKRNYPLSCRPLIEMIEKVLKEG